MIESPQAAVDEIFGRVKAAFDAGAAAIVGSGNLLMFWKGKEEPSKPDPTKYFVRTSTQIVLEGQSTLSSDCAQPGQKRFTADGLVFIQVFCPQKDARADAKGRALATIARNAFRRNVPGDEIVYRNSRIKDDLPPDSGFVRFNVVAEFEYDELS